MRRGIIQSIKKYWPVFYSIAGSFIITAGWDWYHVSHHPKARFILVSLLVWLAVFTAYRLFKFLFIYLTRRFNRHVFWQKEFSQFLDRLFFVFSLLFVVFFFRNELWSFVYVSAVFILIFWRLHYYLARHPAAGPWLIVNRSVFILAYFIFLLAGLFQYLAYRYYILDVNARIFNIVFFRAWSMTMFWLLGFAVAGLIYWRFRRVWRYFLLGLWLALFVFYLIIWSVNIGILASSGLYLSPVIMEHAAGAGAVILGYWPPALLGLLAFAVFVFIFKKVVIAHRQTAARYWYIYSFSLIAVAILSLVSLTSFRNTPESVMLKNFYEYFFGRGQQIDLEPGILDKLRRFGLRYDPSEFYLNHHETVFTETKSLLPEKFAKQRPNIIIVFLESFSARLTGVYNPRFKDLTPGLNKMAADPGTTVFKKYYNASTPTITGLLAQLCSFLPTTGHNEIEEEKRLQKHYLLCLPKVLRQSGGYKYANYVTAVESDYAHKDTIFASMGTNETYGTQELSKYISGEPLSWGYSDHQMFPAFWQIIGQKAQAPFLAMLSTVDTHPPFNLSKDMLTYGDGSDNLLNAVYTTDDAFGKFWDEFTRSPLYKNTILIAVADHAVFPTAYEEKTFPQEAGKMNFYDETAFMMYLPESRLPKEMDVYSSSLDLTPTILQVLNLNAPNAFEGRSIFDDRPKYPNILGMHEFGLYINQLIATSTRRSSYALPGDLDCPEPPEPVKVDEPLTECEYLNFYQWKRQMFEEGRFWEK